MDRSFQLTRSRLYQEAERGLRPISWGSLGLGHIKEVFALPLETLALEDFKDTLESEFAVARGFEKHGRFTAEMWELLEAQRSARAARREQARHYGRLVCRAFFQTTTVSQGMPDLLLSRAYAPVIVELVEEFLNG